MIMPYWRNDILIFLDFEHNINFRGSLTTWGNVMEVLCNIAWFTRRENNERNKT